MTEKIGDAAPKFGDWGSNDVPYTLYFENRRKKKGEEKKVGGNYSGEFPTASSTSSHGSSPKMTPPHALQQPRRAGLVQRNTREEDRLHQAAPIPARHVSSHGRGPNMRSPIHYQANSSGLSKRPGHLVCSEKSPLHSKAEASAVPVFGKWNKKDPSLDEDYSNIFGKLSREKKSPLPNATPRQEEKRVIKKDKTPSCLCFHWLLK